MREQDYKDAPSGLGPLAGTWKDKPHRLIYDLVAEVAALKEELSDPRIARLEEHINRVEWERDQAEAERDRLKRAIEQEKGVSAAYKRDRDAMSDMEQKALNEVRRLKDWKESAMALEATWDIQAVGKALGVPLGEPIHPAILPGITRLRDALEETRNHLSCVFGGSEYKARILREDIGVLNKHAVDSLNNAMAVLNRALSGEGSCLGCRGGSFRHTCGREGSDE